MTESSSRRDLVRYSHAMYDAGWVANHDGNLSVRIQPDRIVLTPTSFSKADVGLDDLVVVDGAGVKTGGRRRPFSELVLHLAVYNGRPDVAAVVHAHPPYATAFGVAGRPLPHPFLPEAVVSLGAQIPTVPLTAPGALAVEALTPFIRRCDAVLLAGNGVLTWGPSIELAYLRMELTEHLAKIAHMAAPLGGPLPLPGDLVEALVEKRRKGGLAAPEEGSAHPSVPRKERMESAVADRVVAGLPGADAQTVARLAREILEGLKR